MDENVNEIPENNPAEEAASESVGEAKGNQTEADDILKDYREVFASADNLYADKAPKKQADFPADESDFRTIPAHVEPMDLSELAEASLLGQRQGSAQRLSERWEAKVWKVKNWLKPRLWNR